MKEVGDGCDASDVDGAGEAGEDALEELPGEVEEPGGRRRVRRGRGGRGGGEADGRLIISPSLAACCLERVILNLNSVG